MKAQALREAFEQGVQTGLAEQEMEPTLRNIFAMVADKFTFPFKVDFAEDVLQITYGTPKDAFDIFNIPSILVQALSDGTFGIRHQGVGTLSPQPAEEVLKSLGRFYGKHSQNR